MAVDRSKIVNKIKPNGSSGDAVDIAPIKMVDGSTDYSASLPTLTGDTTIITNDIAKLTGVFNATSLSYKTGATTAGAEKTVRWYCSGISDGVSNITTPYDGMKIMVKIPRVGLATVGVALSINGNTDAAYHPVAYNVSTVLTSHYPVGSFKVLIYNASATMTGYITAGTATTITGVWQCESDYDADTNTKVRQYQSGTAARTGTQYPILTRYAVTDKEGSYDANYARYNTDTYVDTSTGYIYAPKLYSNSSEVAVKTDIPSIATSISSSSTNTEVAGAKAVYDAIDALPEPMIFKGTLGTGGTITSLPSAGSSNEGFTYKVITAGTYASQSAKVGDVFVSNGTSWILIPSGDDVDDTWRNIKVDNTEKLGSGISTGALNFISQNTNNGDVSFTYDGGIKATAKMPTIPSVYDGKLSIQGDGTTASEFTANQSGNVTLNIKGSGGTTVTTSNDNEITISSNSVTDTNQKIKQGSVTFGSDDVVNFVGGGNITITGNSTNKTMTLGVASGYSIPSTTVQSTWSGKQNALTTSSVTDGTINKAIGFDSNGNIVKGTAGATITFVDWS